MNNPNNVTVGQTVILDWDHANRSMVVIESMTPNQMFSRVRPAILETPKEGDYWDTMTRRLAPAPAFNKEQIEARKGDYVCWDCGTQFLSPKRKSEGEGNVVTASISECGLCGQKKGTTHIRTWNWLRIPD